MIGLLIEDDPTKANKILNFIAEVFPTYEIHHKMSYKSGLELIFREEYKFILLDMSIPTYDQGNGNFSGKPKGFGGRDVLKEMKRHSKYSKVKVITQYNDFDGGTLSIAELDKQLNEKYSGLYTGFIYYNAKESNWQNDLENFLMKFSK